MPLTMLALSTLLTMSLLQNHPVSTHATPSLPVHHSLPALKPLISPREPLACNSSSSDDTTTAATLALCSTSTDWGSAVPPWGVVAEALERCDPLACAAE